MARGKQNSADLVPPADIECEEGVLSACLIFPESLEAAVDSLDPDCFYRTSHRKIFEALKFLHEAGIEADIVSVAGILVDRGDMEVVGGASYLSGFLDRIPPASNMDYYCRRLVEKRNLRRAIEHCNAVLKRAYDPSRDPDETIEFMQSISNQIAMGHTGDSVSSLSDDLEKIIERYETRYAQNMSGETPGIDTGFSMLNYLMSGFQPSDLVLLAARPSMGKTALALSFARTASKAGHPALIFSLEMSSEQIDDRNMAAYSKIDLLKFRNGEFDADDWERIENAKSEAINARIYVDDTPGMTIEKMRRVARRHHAKYGIGMIVLDYIQLMSSQAKENRNIEVSEISKGLKLIARELNVPVIALSQLNRSVDSRQDKIPRLSDLRDSGSLEQDADVVLFLYRPHAYQLEERYIGESVLSIGKQRNGPTGTVQLVFKDKWATFYELNRQQEYGA